MIIYVQRPHLSLPSAAHPLQSTNFMYLDQTPHFGLLNLYMNPILETKQNNYIPLLLAESLLVKSSMISGWDQLKATALAQHMLAEGECSLAESKRETRRAKDWKFATACHENLQQNWNQKLALGSLGLSNNTLFARAAVPGDGVLPPGRTPSSCALAGTSWDEVSEMVGDYDGIYIWKYIGAIRGTV